MSKLQFYAAVHTSGFIREVKLAESFEQAEKIMMYSWTDELKAEYTIEPVIVTRLTNKTE